MPAAVGSMFLPSILPAGMMSSLGAGGPLFSSVLGGGIGSALTGGDFWKGALGGLANGLMPAIPGSGFGPLMGNALRGAITSGIGGGNPLQGAMFGGLMGGLGQPGSALGGTSGGFGQIGADSVSGGVLSPEFVTPYDTFMGNMTTPYSELGNPYYGGQNALRSMSGAGASGGGIDMVDGAQLMKAGYSAPDIGANWGSAFGNDAAMRDFAGSASMGINPYQGDATMPAQAPGQAAQQGSALDPYVNYLKGYLKPETLIPALGKFGLGMYQTKMANDMAEKQMDLAREMDTGLGVRKQAAGYAMNPDRIPGSPGYQAALNERRRALMRLQSQKGGLNGGALPAQLSDAAQQQMGNWWQMYANTANRSAPAVSYPNYQNMLRSM